MIAFKMTHSFTEPVIGFVIFGVGSYKFFQTFSAANNARTKPFCADVNIIAAQWMSSLADKTKRTNNIWSSSAQYIFNVWYSFKMKWVDTFSYATKVVKFASLWNWSHKPFVSNPVGVLRDIPLGWMLNPNLSIPCASKASCPLPALGRFVDMDFFNQPLQWSLFHSNRILQEATG